jgi:hypothetical protein
MYVYLIVLTNGKTGVQFPGQKILFKTGNKERSIMREWVKTLTCEKEHPSLYFRSFARHRIF